MLCGGADTGSALTNSLFNRRFCKPSPASSSYTIWLKLSLFSPKMWWEGKMKQEDYSALFISAIEASNSYQALHWRLVKAEYTVLFVASVFSMIFWTMSRATRFTRLYLLSDWRFCSLARAESPSMKHELSSAITAPNVQRKSLNRREGCS
jgi:hypothetical protein